MDLAIAPMRAGAGPSAGRNQAGVVTVYQGDGQITGRIDPDDNPPPHITLWGARDTDLLGTELYTADITGDGRRELVLPVISDSSLSDLLAENALLRASVTRIRGYTQRVKQKTSPPSVCDG